MVDASTVLLTSDCARLLGVSAETVRKMAKRGELSVTRAGKGWRLFDRSEVERLAKQRIEAERAGQ